MASTTFSSGTVIPSTWLNDVNSLVWGVFGGATTALAARTALGITGTVSGGNITLGGNLTFSGAFNTTFTVTGTTTLTLPTTGTVATTSNKLSAFAATTSAELAGVISDETGSGALVFANTPTLVTPNIGAATGTSLTVSGALYGVGSVVQVVTGTTTTSTQSTSTTYSDTTLTATITPKSNTSKILVLVSQPYRSSRAADSTNGYIQLQRNGSALQTTGELGIETAAGALSVVQGVCAMAYLDSPGSTSALTYKTQQKVGVALNSASITTQYSSYQSNIVLLEIGG